MAGRKMSNKQEGEDEAKSRLRRSRSLLVTDKFIHRAPVRRIKKAELRALGATDETAEQKLEKRKTITHHFHNTDSIHHSHKAKSKMTENIDSTLGELDLLHDNKLEGDALQRQIQQRNKRPSKADLKTGILGTSMYSKLEINKRINFE